MTETNKYKFEARLSANEGLHISSTIRKHSIEIDEPAQLGGTDKGPNPVELVLAALGSCQAIILKIYAEKIGVQLKSLETIVEGDLDAGGFLGVPNIRPGFQKVKATTKIKAKGSQAKIQELLKLAEERCPVLDILRNPVPVEIQITKD